MSLPESIVYLSSPEAVASIRRDVYWPKWNSPWWHMLVLHEMGMAKEIPKSAIDAMVEGLDNSPSKIFPFAPSDLPAGVDMLSTHCHCALGSMYQVLAAWGVDVDRELPWIRAWFLKYQMQDGGLNCDNSAYLVEGECPSSMVGTIAPFESVLLYTPRPWTAEETSFLSRAAHFLMQRQLRLGSPTKHNAEERASEVKWTRLCFPRLYLYDVLRGLHALLQWADKTQSAIPADVIAPVVNDLAARFPDGKIINERHAYQGISTRNQLPSGEWLRGQPASLFPLLQSESVIGQESVYLTRQWNRCRELIQKVNMPERPAGWAIRATQSL